MIVILDYDMGNIGSIQNMLKHIGEKDVLITRDEKEVMNADKVILPGVGSFDKGMQNLKKYGLIEMIQEHAVKQRKPLLGICLGMQLLGNESEEGSEEGLKLIDFQNKRFHFEDENIKIPHMGWNYVNIRKVDSSLVQDIDGTPRYYFVHSFHAICNNNDNILMECEYGYKFTAAVQNDNIYGTQFHPEKSHKYGMKIFQNFVSKC